MIYILSMDIQFLTHNHLEDPNSFEEMDPQLHRLKSALYLSIKIKELPVETPNLYRHRRKTSW